MKRLLLVMMVCFFLPFLLSACGAPFHGPQQFATSKEVFNDVQNGILTIDAPSDSMLRVVYDAPYEDVFRIAKVSAIQLQLFVEESNKDAGVIFATQSNRIDRSVNTYIKATATSHGWVESEKRFYLISIKELTGETTEVKIVNKIQLECRADADFTGGYKVCEEKTKVHWPSGPEKNIQALERFHSFLSNNLISAGLL